MDVFWGGLLGFYALIYTTAGYVNGFFKRMFYDEDIKLPLGMIAASELVYGLVVYFCLFMLQENSISLLPFPYYSAWISIYYFGYDCFIPDYSSD